MPKIKNRSAKLYERNGRWYGDFRCYSDVGGKQEALAPAGESRATTDRTVANALLAERTRYYEGLRRGVQLGLPDRTATLSEAYIEHHLRSRKKYTDTWNDEVRRHLTVAREFFEARGETRLAALGVKDVQAYVEFLSQRDNGRSGKLTGRTQLAYLVSLGNLYRRAQSESLVPPGYNPVASLLPEDKPKVRKLDRLEVLEIDDASLFLEAARLYKTPRENAIDCAYELVATFLLTGGREAEILGLLVSDIDLRRGTIHIRPNSYRRIKNDGSHREVPLWPQLREILTPYLERRAREGGELLFRTPRKHGDGMITDLRKMLDGIARLAGMKQGHVRSKMFRHTYASVRIQTLDNGHPVATWLIAREMGHGGTRLIDKVYGHPLKTRARLDVVEYRIESYAEQLDGALAKLKERARRQLSAEERRALDRSNLVAPLIS